MSLKTLLVVMCLVLTVAFLGCVDLPSDGPEFPDFRTQTRFIQADASLGTASVTVDGASAASVDYRSASAYMDIAAGNRSVEVSGDGSATSLALEADGKITVVIFPKESATAARFRKYTERRTFDTIPDTTGQVRFISAGLDTAGGSGSYDVVNMADSSVVVGAMALRDNSGYMNMPAGSYTFGMAPAGTQEFLATVDVTLANGQRFTAVIFGDQTSAAIGSFQDD